MSGGTKKPDPPNEDQRTAPKKGKPDKKIAQTDKPKDKRRV
jgi:hypothetical protein